MTSSSPRSPNEPGSGPRLEVVSLNQIDNKEEKTMEAPAVIPERSSSKSPQQSRSSTILRRSWSPKDHSPKEKKKKASPTRSSSVLSKIAGGVHTATKGVTKQLSKAPNQISKVLNLPHKHNKHASNKETNNNSENENNDGSEGKAPNTATGTPEKSPVCPATPPARRMPFSNDREGSLHKMCEDHQNLTVHLCWENPTSVHDNDRISMTLIDVFLSPRRQTSSGKNMKGRGIFSNMMHGSGASSSQTSFSSSSGHASSLASSTVFSPSPKGGRCSTPLTKTPSLTTVPSLACIKESSRTLVSIPSSSMLRVEANLSSHDLDSSNRSASSRTLMSMPSLASIKISSTRSLATDCFDISNRSDTTATWDMDISEKSDGFRYGRMVPPNRFRNLPLVEDPCGGKVLDESSPAAILLAQQAIDKIDKESLRWQYDEAAVKYITVVGNYDCHQHSDHHHGNMDAPMMPAHRCPSFENIQKLGSHPHYPPHQHHDHHGNKDIPMMPANRCPSFENFQKLGNHHNQYHSDHHDNMETPVMPVHRRASVETIDNHRHQQQQQQQQQHSNHSCNTDALVMPENRRATFGCTPQDHSKHHGTYHVVDDNDYDHPIAPIRRATAPIYRVQKRACLMTAKCSMSFDEDYNPFAPPSPSRAARDMAPMLTARQASLLHFE